MATQTKTLPMNHPGGGYQPDGGNPTNYIGYHVGDVDDFYDNSSEHPILMELNKTAIQLEIERGDEPEEYEAYVYEKEYDWDTNEMRTIILGYGNKTDMYNLERDLHKKHKVGTSGKYFNIKASSGAYKTIRVSDLEDLKNKVLLGEFTKSEKENIVDLYNELIVNSKRLQNRVDEDSDFVKEISQDIMLEGNTDSCEDIRVKVNKDGTRSLYDGNTTLMGAYGARKKVSDISVSEVPYNVSSQFTDEEFNELGVLLNKKPKNRKRPCSKYDVAQVIYKRFINDGTEIKDPENKKYIEATGWKPSIIYQVVQAWKNKGKMVGTYINYQLPQYKDLKDKKVEHYTDKQTHVLSMSSGSFKDDSLNDFITTNINFGKCKAKKKSLIIVIHHPNETAEDAWDTKHMVTKKKQIKCLCALTGVVFKGFRYMDTL